MLEDVRAALMRVAVPALAVAAVGTAGCMEAGDSAKFPSGDTVTVPAGTIFDHDLYAFGRTVTIAGTVEGDVVAAAESVHVTGVVTGDLWAASREVSVTGAVNGDLRAAAETVNVGGQVGEDVLAAGNSVSVPGSVGGDLILGARTVTVAGTVRGDVIGRADTYSLSGAVGGREKIHISPKAQAASLSLDEEAWAAGRRMATLLLLGLLLVLVTPGLVANPAGHLNSSPWHTLLWGVLSVVGAIAIMIGILIAGVLAAVGFASANLGSLAALAVFVMILGEVVLIAAMIVSVIFLAPLAVAVAFGRFLFGKISSGAATTRFLPLILGVLLLVALESIPVAGDFARFFAVLFGMGALFLGVFGGPGKALKRSGDGDSGARRRTRRHAAV